MIELSAGREEHIGTCIFRHSGRGGAGVAETAGTESPLCSWIDLMFLCNCIGKVGSGRREMTVSAAVSQLSDNMDGSGPEAPASWETGTWFEF